MRKIIFGLLLLVLLLAVPATLAQSNDEKVTVPKSMLTQEQLDKIQKENTWIGLGKEIGIAIDSSLHAITAQSNDFAKTPVGKLTVVLVIWKIVGDQLIHVFVGLLELLIFMPLWIWSYRKTCITRTFKLPDKTIRVVEYDRHGEMTPRIAHSLILIGIVIVFLCTVFTY